MQITPQTLATIAGKPANANMASTIAGLARAGVGAGLNRPHRLAMYLGQLAHESMGWHYDREVWGPTAAQKRYDTRTDLGNSAAADGDGYRYRGRGPIQLTGRANYAAFTSWARSMDRQAPDFVADPDAVLTDPWEGLAPIWFWDRGGLNRYADQGDFLTVTRRINGGTNGLADRERYYTRAALVLLGYSPREISRFQTNAKLKPDGIAGPATRAALHRALSASILVRFPLTTPSVDPFDEGGWTAPSPPVATPAQANAPKLGALLIAALAAALVAYVKTKG